MNQELRSLYGTFTAVEKNKYSMWYESKSIINCLYICLPKYILNGVNLYSGKFQVPKSKREVDERQVDFSQLIDLKEFYDLTVCTLQHMFAVTTQDQRDKSPMTVVGMAAIAS